MWKFWCVLPVCPLMRILVGNFVAEVYFDWPYKANNLDNGNIVFCYTFTAEENLKMNFYHQLKYYTNL